MSRTARLLELMIRVQARPRFTAAELAGEFGVSRRTILRDLGALKSMGVPLLSSPGPGGGYSLPKGGRRLSPSLTVDEALGLIASYEALLRYADSPLSERGLSAVTKLRAAMPKDVVSELDRMRRHVAVLEAHRGGGEAPLLGELLSAALDGAHLKVAYDSATSGVTERVIFPFGVFAYRGFWYCACYDHKRDKKASFRADRFLSVERVGGFGRPAHVPLEEWFAASEGGGKERLRLRVRFNRRAARSADLAFFFGRVDAAGGVAEMDMDPSDVDFYASRLLGLGTDVRVESPPEVVEAVREKASAIAETYGHRPGPDPSLPHDPPRIMR